MEQTRTPSRMSKSVAKEIVDRTPEAQRSAFMKRNSAGHKRRNVTDRALRYRANATPPPGPKRCCLCGNPKARAEVGHVNGHEEDTDPRNLFWTCRSCNVKAANTLRKAKMGRLTKQYNPAGGADSLGAWMNAIASIKGEGGTMAVPDAVAMIHATSPDQRSEFAREIWHKRYTKYEHGMKKKNTPRRKNLFGFGGGSKVTFDSRLARDAYNRGYLGRKDFETWLKAQGKLNLASSLKKDLEHAFDRGQSDRLAADKAAVEMKILKSEKRETKAPAIPAGKKASDQSETYRGHLITRTASGWDVLGEKNWGSLKDAKEYVDLYELTGGKASVRKKNAKKACKPPRKNASGKRYKSALRGKDHPKAKRNSYTHPKGTGEAELRQGKSKAQIFETGTGKHTAEIISGSGAREEHSFSGPGSFKAAMSWARLRLHEVAKSGGHQMEGLPAGSKAPAPES